MEDDDESASAYVLARIVLRYPRMEEPAFDFGAENIMMKRIFLLGTIVGIALAHGVVLYKIDTGVRSSDVKPVMAARSHKAFW